MEKSPFAQEVQELQVVGGCRHVQGVGMDTPASVTSCTERAALFLPFPGLLPEAEQ